MAKSKKVSLPLFAIIVLIIGVVWLLTELGIVTANLPWWPIVIIAVALNWIYEFYNK